MLIDLYFSNYKFGIGMFFVYWGGEDKWVWDKKILILGVL